MPIWNERIHKKRIEKGFTLAQVAEKLGVTEATAQRYERGNIKNIPYEYMCAYGEMLNCSPAFLMGWEEDVSEKEKKPKIIQYYEILNDIGKHEATKRVEELTHFDKYTTPKHLLLNAAHERTDIEVTKEMLQHDEDIMDDDDF